MLYTKLKHRTKELKELTELGLIDPHWIRDLKIFEEFHALPQKCKLCRYEILADQFEVSSVLIRKIIATMGN